MPKREITLNSRANGKTHSLRASLKVLGIKWPGDGEYARGTQVYLVNSRRTICLAEKLGVGRYRTEGGGLYVETKTALGYNQELTYPAGASRSEFTMNGPMADSVASAYAAFVEKKREIPTVLHISYDDLVKLGQERAEVAESGNTWGLTISLVPRGEAMSVDRRIDL